MVDHTREDGHSQARTDLKGCSHGAIVAKQTRPTPMG